jgi:hypothetical protein
MGLDFLDLEDEMPSAPQCDESVLFISALFIARDYAHTLPPDECWPIISGLLLHQDEDE